MALLSNNVAAAQRHLELVGKTVLISDSPSYCAFLDLCRVNSGELLLVYYAGAGHTDPHATIQIRMSTDNGQTWSAGRTAVPAIHAGYGVRDPHMIQLADGTLLLNYFIYPSTDENSVRSKVVRSSDMGRTWSDPVPADTPMQWTACCGKILCVDAKTLLLPVYGRMKGEGERSGVLRSTDQGKSWSDFVTVATADAAKTKECNEMELTILGDSIVGFVRPGLRVVSKDKGKTWSSAEKTINLHAPGLWVDDTGLFMNHRCDGMAKLSLSIDGGKTFPESIALSPVQHGDCAYGAIVKIPGANPAAYFTAFYMRDGGSVRLVGRYFNVK